MQLTPYRTSAPGDTVISFPRLECWNTITKVATVAADVNKNRVLCRISLKILQDQFGALDEAPMQSVAQHRMVIEEAARRLIERELYEEDGSVIIRACDL